MDNYIYDLDGNVIADYYIYDSAGQILKSGVSKNLEKKKARLPRGQFLGLGKADDSKQKVVDGKLVDGQVPVEDRIVWVEQTAIQKITPTPLEAKIAKLSNGLTKALKRITALEEQIL